MINEIEHFAYPLPFKRELCELGYTDIYKTTSGLERKAQHLFSHPTLPKQFRELFVQVSTSGSRCLVRDMCNEAVRMVRYFNDHPQQFGAGFMNIEMQILVRMWKQTFRHTTYQVVGVEKYVPTTMKLLAIDNGFFDELIEVVGKEQWVIYSDMEMQMEKKRTERGFKGVWGYNNITNEREKFNPKTSRVSLGTHEGGKTFEYLSNLE